MITELLGLAGSGVAGSVFGIFSDWMKDRAENKRLEIQLEIQRRANENGQVLKHLQGDGGFTSGWSYSIAFLVLVCTYCACCGLCLYWPDVPVHTFNPDEIPKKISLLWGFFSWERQTNSVYTISTGGVGYALLHPVAFQIGTVITGLSPMKRK